MLTSPITLVYAGNNVNMARVNQDNFSAIYFGKDGANDERQITLTVKHTIPQKSDDSESHLARLDVMHYDSAGVFVRRTSSWTVFRTEGIQKDSDSEDTYDALSGFLSGAGIVGQVLGRES